MSHFAPLQPLPEQEREQNKKAFRTLLAREVTRLFATPPGRDAGPSGPSCLKVDNAIQWIKHYPADKC